MTSITMASRCLDNLLPPGAQNQREADYLCLAVTCAIMYHPDGSTVNTTGFPSGPQPAGAGWRSYVFLTWRAAPSSRLPSAQHSWPRWGPAGFPRPCAERWGRGKLDQRTESGPHHASTGLQREAGRRGKAPAGR